VRQCAVASLQKGDHAVDGLRVAFEVVQKKIDRAAAFFFGQDQCGIAQLGQALATHEPQHQRQCQVGLHRRYPARAQKAGEVGGGRVGCVELRHRRDEAQHLEIGWTGHVAIIGVPPAEGAAQTGACWVATL